MRSLQLMGPGQAAVVELPTPVPGPGEVLVRVSLVNTCPQWDLHLNAGEPMFPGAKLNYPYTPGQPGHEMVGVVAALGENVEGFTVGQRVAAWRDPGHHRAGCYAEYVCHAAENLLPVPDEVEDLAVASLELAMCVAASVLPLKKMDAIAGKRAAVNGLGAAGLVAAQMLHAEGAASVIGFEPSEARRELARSFAVDAAYDPRDPETAERFPGRRGRNAPIDVAVDCVGYPDAVHFLMDRVAGHLALFAVQRHDYTFSVAHYHLNLLGYAGHYRGAAEYALGLIRDGKLNLRPLVSVQLPLEQYAEGIALLRSGKAVKIGFRP